MSLRLKFIITAISCGILAYVVGPYLWPPLNEAAEYQDIAGILAAVESLIESLGFGIAIAYLFFIGIPHIRNAKKEEKSRITLFVLSLTWMLGSWWAHTNLHKALGYHANGLIAVEYLFHVTSTIAAVIVIYMWYTLYVKPQQK